MTQVERRNTFYDYEFSIPLGILGLKATRGQKIQGDIGLLRGDAGQTYERVLLHRLYR